MNDLLVTMLASMGSSLVLVGVAVWLSKAWLSERLRTSIQHEYSHKLEAFKAQLQANNGIELEKLKSDLRVAAQQREAQFSGLHKKRAETIEQLHSMLQDLAVIVARFRRARVQERDANEAEARLKERTKDFADYFRCNKIFLPRELETKVMNLSNAVLDSAQRITSYAQEGADEEQLALVDREFDDSIRELFEDLKANFRQLLGDDS